MKFAFFAMTLGAVVLLAGCGRKDPIDIGVGDAGISSGTGGEGAGPTGTQGDLPAENPGADAPNADNGTGTDAPSP